ncbi:MAG: hypothetical protein P9L99_14175 [Candidatus Lernaella stagnicola]|nr:hypothetical protein [Candidatus Lernaella stagnicola]
MPVPLPLILTTDVAGILAAWESIDLDSDMLVPSDMLHLVGPSTQDGVPMAWPLLARCNRLIATLGPVPIFTGNRSSATNEVSQTGDQIAIEGCDAAKVLVDSPPLIRFRRPAGSLATFAAELCGQLAVPVVVDAAAQIPRAQTTSASPSQPVWSILEPIAKECGCTMWCDATGVLRIESLLPYYAIPPVATLASMPSGPQAAANNITSYTLRDDVEARFSHIVVQGGGGQRARHGTIATGMLGAPALGMAVDPELISRGVYRPLVLVDQDAKSIAQAQAKAMREVALRRLQGTKIELEVAGFTTETGLPWQVAQMVLVSIPHKGVAGPMFVIARRLMQDLSGGSRTRLTLVEPGVM